MVNIIYNITEKHKEDTSPNNIDAILEDLNAELDTELLKKHLKIPDIINEDLYTHEYIEDDTAQLELEYTNFTVQELTRIIEYYGLQKRRMKKNELIQTLVLFETDEQNLSIVQHRRRLWDNIY